MSEELTSPLAALCDTEQIFVTLQCMMGTSISPCDKYVFTGLHVSWCNHRHPFVHPGRQEILLI